jgi:hypothetical protein
VLAVSIRGHHKIRVGFKWRRNYLFAEKAKFFFVIPTLLEFVNKRIGRKLCALQVRSLHFAQALHPSFDGYNLFLIAALRVCAQLTLDSHVRSLYSP